jgi:hypothetical protein
MTETGKNNIWLQRAKSAYDSSTSYIDNNYRERWEDNLRHFQNRHHGESKYYKDSYKYRSKIFRPKTRSAVRSNEAAAMAAFFGNMDVVDAEPMNTDDINQVASAEVAKALLNYRLQHTIPWFMLCIGAVQEAQVYGVVCSYQKWIYEEKITHVEMPVLGMDGQQLIDDRTGEPLTEKVEEVEVLKDKPVIELLPVENVRIHPAADWLDPINSSPYVIRLIPMYVQDVRAKMEQEDPKTGAPKWKKVTDDEMRSATKPTWDVTRNARSNGAEDRYEQEQAAPLGDFDIVWVHENFMRIGGNEMVYYTLGTEFMLTDPRPLKEVYHHGERPLVLGVSVIEAHQCYPAGLVQIGDGLQKEVNEIANQRLDNVKLVLNKQYLVRRGKQVDVSTLLKNVPGSVTLVSDVDGDVRELNWPEVTGSSYQEQDRLNVDFDEIMGSFSTSSVQTNRQLNETVGGMNMLRGGANSLTEYLLRTISETWMEPVMRQLLKLEQAYETDQVVLAIAAQKAKLFQKFGIDEITDELLEQELTITVNVGTGATDPVAKLERFLLGVNTLTQIMQAAPPNLNVEEVQKEIFGRLGYKDGARFFQKGPPPAVQQLQQQLQALQQQLQSKQAETQGRMQIEQVKQQHEDVRTDKELHTDILLKKMDLANRLNASQQKGQNGRAD